MEHLGEKNYSSVLPALITIGAYVGIEVYVYVVARSIANLSTLAILIPFVLVIYFSFRDGIRGGFVAGIITIFFYLYIIFSLHYAGSQKTSGLITTGFLGALYILLACIIGGLKQRIDTLMGAERQARQLAEEGRLRLETILQQLPVGVLIADAKERKFTANKYMEKIVGKKIDEFIRYEPHYVSRIAFASQKPIMLEKWPIIRALDYGETVPDEEIEYIRHDKKRLYLRVNAAPIKGTDGEIIAAVSTIYDYSQIKELEMRKDDFVNIASHELKTPITSIMLYVDALISKAKDPKTKKIAMNIKVQTGRLQKLVSDLLDVSRLQTGKMSFTKEKFSLDKLVAEATSQLQDTTQQPLILSQTFHAVVMADKFRIYQVLTNILTNAIKYSQGKGNITISLYSEKDSVICSVQDFGIGIEKGKEKKIFERLYRGNSDKENTFPGFGMGLFISQEIIKRHLGRIWVHSEVDRGSTFYFSLPLAKREKKI